MIKDIIEFDILEDMVKEMLCLVIVKDILFIQMAKIL